MNGAQRIAAERQRQIDAEGFNAAHDAQHRSGQLAIAASVYACPPERRGDAPLWPWSAEWFKALPGNRIRELEKAGALIAAEIDRLLTTERPERGEEVR